MQTLITTITNRPYVFVFLLIYLVAAARVAGGRWTLFYLAAGYATAFVSEYLSINYGFPYGPYKYVYENLRFEWQNHGVPVWDSLSYVFMCFSGLYAACFFSEKRRPLTRCKLVLLSAILTTILDIIIDPVAHRGSEWFLGQVYTYPKPGPYFDVTLSNFLGWFVVSGAINAVGVWGLKFKPKVTILNSFLSLGLYFGIAVFGVGVAVYLNAWALLICDLFWAVGTMLLLTPVPACARDPRKFLQKQV